MSKLEHTRPLMNILTNIYKLGGVKSDLSYSSCDELNPSTHTCGRLFARAVRGVAFVVSLCFLTGACQQATLIPDEEAQSTENARGTETKTDSVDVNVDTEDWEGTDDVDFDFGGSEQENDE